MEYIAHYDSPLGRILLASDDLGLSGLWFEEKSRYFALGLDSNHIEKDVSILDTTKNWLDIYFSGREPEFTVPLHIKGSDFYNEVSRIMCTIPYGKTMTYGEIAAIIAEEHGIPRMSARAVGGAVGHNKISIIVPCHRVVGKGGNLTGYGGGIKRKVSLLELERADLSSFYIPKKGTAL